MRAHDTNGKGPIIPIQCCWDIITCISGLWALLHPSPDPPAGCFPGGCVLEVAGGASKATDKEEDWVYLPFPVNLLSQAALPDTLCGFQALPDHWPVSSHLLSIKGDVFCWALGCLPCVEHLVSAVSIWGDVWWSHTHPCFHSDEGIWFARAAGALAALCPLV